ncbi:hypothetical protein [Ruicaihuangia caeni]|uniref:Uncharacterized protein n=1 Tax=Ruicaihuangia caeni TaxID=3042517 RepID=A0AAW6T7M6_9MICO|nr:hypothetical protein [Klugiella sp. YN-L-19]MDI2099539.1 hypothetical protein [Klugiella sp. YN-L-19]
MPTATAGDLPAIAEPGLAPRAEAVGRDTVASMVLAVRLQRSGLGAISGGCRTLAHRPPRSTKETTNA